MPIRLTRAVKALMIACFAAFLVQQTADQFLGGNLLEWFGLTPSAFLLKGRVWQLFTYAFLHGDVMHLFLNLMMLAFIGGELEALWGTRRFLKFYFFCSGVAGLFYLVLQMFSSDGGIHVPMVGASGAIYGLLAAYGILFSERVLLFMMIFPMKAKHFIWVLAAIEFMSTIYSGRSGLASIAHVGGMAAGFGYLWGAAAWKVMRRRRNESKETRKAAKDAADRAKRRKSADHLKLVIDNEGEGKADRDADPTPKTWH